MAQKRSYSFEEIGERRAGEGERGEQVRGQRGRLSDVSQGVVIRVDELARSIQARVSRNPDLLFAFRFVEWRSVGNCRRCRWKPLLLPDLSRVRTCIKHGDVTVRRHLTAAGEGLWKGLRSRLDGYFRCVFRNRRGRAFPPRTYTDDY